MSEPVASSQPSVDGIWGAFARSVRQNMVAEMAVQVLRLGAMVILARALRPADFGLFRTLAVVATLATLANQSGIPDALIQRKDLTSEDEDTALWLTIAISFLTGALLYAAAPLLARAMAMRDLTYGVRLLCIPILLDGTTAVANASLRRRLLFGILAGAEVVGEATFAISALALLWAGYPMMCLPGGLALRYAARAITVWIAEHRLPRSMPTLRSARSFARFSAATFSGRFIATLSANADYLLIGRLLGESALGIYSIAWDLLRILPDRLHHVAVRVTLPAFCQLQDDDAALVNAYREFFNYLARIMLPVAVCVAVVAPELLNALYGSRWLSAAMPLRLLAPALVFMGLRQGVGSIYYAKDHPSFDIYLHGVRLCLIGLAVSIFGSFGLIGVSAAMSVVQGAVTIAALAMVCVLIELTPADLISSAGPGIGTAALCGAAAFAGRFAAELAGLETHAVLAAAAIPAALAYLATGRSKIAELIAFGFRRVPVTDAPARVQPNEVGG